MVDTENGEETKWCKRILTATLDYVHTRELHQFKPEQEFIISQGNLWMKIINENGYMEKNYSSDE